MYSPNVHNTYDVRNHDNGMECNRENESLVYGRNAMLPYYKDGMIEISDASVPWR